MTGEKNGQELAADYLSAVDTDSPSIAAVEIMDRLTERLKATDTIKERLVETQAAGVAVADVAGDADNPLPVIQSAKNCTGEVAQKAGMSKGPLQDAIDEATSEVRQEAADTGLSLEHGYAFDRYMEENLEEVKKQCSTDHNDDPVYQWVFDDGTSVETSDGTHYEHYNFWRKVARSTDKKLQPDFVSEEIGDPDENEEQYAELSIGPTSRPWAVTNWVQCITDLVEDRVKRVTTDGPRTVVWRALANEIGRSRAVRDKQEGVSHTMMTVEESADGELLEVWVPSKVIMRECEEHGIEPRALQQELAARGVDSDELDGERIAETVQAEGRSIRFWRFDASHPEVPEPSEIVDEVTLSTDSLEGMEWGGEE